MTLKGSGQVIGSCAIFLNESGEEAEIGFSFGKPFWGLGYASETLQALIAFAFGHPNLRGLVATTDMRNVGSQKVLERGGFVRTHVKLNHLMLRDGPRDTAFYKLSRPIG